VLLHTTDQSAEYILTPGVRTEYRMQRLDGEIYLFRRSRTLVWELQFKLRGSRVSCVTVSVYPGGSVGPKQATNPLKHFVQIIQSTTATTT
jgi:hypothetical protein